MKFTEQNILLNCQATNKLELLTLISKHAKEMDIVDSQEALLNDFLHREYEGTTGLQDGFAIPHAKSDSVKEATVIYARNAIELKDWETFDDQPVMQVFALLVPKEEQGTKHIEMLSKLAMALMEDEFKEQVTKLTDKTQLANVIDNEMNGVEV